MEKERCEEGGWRENGEIKTWREGGRERTEKERHEEGEILRERDVGKKAVK